MVQITYKVPDGKLLKLKLDLDESKVITSFQLRGDFFMYPEDGFLEIEKFIIGKPLAPNLFVELEQFVLDKGYEIFGFKSADIQEAINSFLE